ncbi:MAG: hypothetical protein Q8943_15440 [Bacteroidota bacterium]|nr:hypothetical protein [Bacteroidota bacterium]
MNLNLFHHPPSDGSPGNYYWQDKLNGFSSLAGCRFLEWSGWYNFSVGHRLLGHHRFFQHFKKSYLREPRDLPPIQSYILQYRLWHGMKYFVSKVMAVTYSIVTWKDYFLVAEMAAVNRMLVTNWMDILIDFLRDSDEHFDAAFVRAVRLIRERLQTGHAAQRTLNLAVAIDHSKEYYTSHHQHAYHHFESVTHNHTHPTQVFTPPAVIDGAKGKEKDVYSKRQILIYHDLLHEAYGVEPLRIENKNCHPGIASFLHRLHGKPERAWLDELKDYRNGHLYDCQSDGEIDQLLIVLTNMRASLRAAGQSRMVDKIDDKMLMLRKKKKKE